MKKKLRKIFTEEDLYKFCSGEVCAISVEVESGGNLDWTDFTEEELERKYNSLSNAGQNEFDKKLRKVAIKLKKDFDSLPQKIKNEEEYRELEDEKKIIKYKIANELNEFLTE